MAYRGVSKREHASRDVPGGVAPHEPRVHNRSSPAYIARGGKRRTAIIGWRVAMKRVHIRWHWQPGTGTSAKVLTAVAGVIVFAIVMLVAAGLWVALAAGMTLLVVAGLVVALLPHRVRARLPRAEGRTHIDVRVGRGPSADEKPPPAGTSGSDGHTPSG